MNRQSYRLTLSRYIDLFVDVYSDDNDDYWSQIAEYFTEE